MFDFEHLKIWCQSLIEKNRKFEGNKRLGKTADRKKPTTNKLKTNQNFQPKIFQKKHVFPT